MLVLSLGVEDFSGNSFGRYYMSLRQINTTFPQQINFKGTLEKDIGGRRMFFIAEKQQNTIPNISLTH